MDVVVWLRSLGLGKYEALFRENDIDETVLPNLTAEDLKELGVASLGHRRKLLDAIAALRADPAIQNRPRSARAALRLWPLPRAFCRGPRSRLCDDISCRTKHALPSVQPGPVWRCR